MLPKCLSNGCKPRTRYSQVIARHSNDPPQYPDWILDKKVRALVPDLTALQHLRQVAGGLLRQFRQAIYKSFPYRRDSLLDLLDVLSSNVRARSTAILNLKLMYYSEGFGCTQIGRLRTKKL